MCVTKMESQFQDGLVGFSDDDRSSVAADSWSIRSEYGGSVQDADELVRQVDAVVDAPSMVNEPVSETNDEEKMEDEDDNENEPSVLGLQSHWDNTYVGELSNFEGHGDEGEIWFGESVMETVVEWTARLCASMSAFGQIKGTVPHCTTPADLSSWNVLDVGTGNGVFLHELQKQGFTDLTGTDYSEPAIELAKTVAAHKGLSNIRFMVDDVLATSIEEQFKLVTDKGTLDAIGLHPEGPARRALYWKSMCKLIAPGGLLVLTSCNHTVEELKNEASKSIPQELGTFEYVDHVRSYPTYSFGGVEGTKVATIALRFKQP